MHVTMVKKRLADGSECAKCAQASEHLRSRGLWDRIDEVVWTDEHDPTSPGLAAAARHGIDRAPFFIVRDGDREDVYASVLQLVRERFGQAVSTTEQAAAVDVDDIGI